MIKYSFLLSIFCLTEVLAKSHRPEDVLTYTQDNIVVTYPSQTQLSNEAFQETAAKYVAILKENVYSKVPSEYLKLILDRKVQISFGTFKTTDGKISNQSGGFKKPDTESEPLHIGLSQAGFTNPNETLSRLVHEWFHALHFLIHPNEAPWVQEGLATLFVYLTAEEDYPKYPGQGFYDALKGSSTPLKFPFDPRKYIVSEAYGHVFLYFLYLYRNCEGSKGGDDLFWRLAASKNGVYDEDTINLALQGTDADFCGDFKMSAIRAEIARFHNRAEYLANGEKRDHYLIVPELSDFETITTTEKSPKWKEQVLGLPLFQPMIFPASMYSLLKAAKLSPNFKIITLQKVDPFGVLDYLPKKGKSTVMVLRVK